MNSRIVVLTGLALSACMPPADAPSNALRGDPERGRAALAALECGACHVIPGVPGAHSHVGPTLEHFATSVYIGGRFPNTPDVLMRWVRDAPSMAPKTAMPQIAMDEAQAQDIAAYLYTLE